MSFSPSRYRGPETDALGTLRWPQAVRPGSRNPDRIRIAFDDHRLVANAGLLLPATLAWHLGLRELVDHHLDLGGAPGRANRGDKMLTLVASALAGGDCIDDADALRAGGTCSRLRSQGAIHPGDLPAQLSLGPRPSTRPREPPVAGPGMASRGRTRRLAPDHRPGLHHLRDLRTGQGGSAPPRLYRRPWLSPAAGHCRRHRRRADGPAARGPGQHRSGHTSCGNGRVRYAGARGQLTVFYTHAIVAVCRRMDVRFSITIRQHASHRGQTDSLLDSGAADVAETTSELVSEVFSNEYPAFGRLLVNTILSSLASIIRMSLDF